MVKKLVFKLIMMLVIMFGLGNYALYLTTGRSPLDLVSMWSKLTEKAAVLNPNLESLSGPEVESQQGGSTVLRAGTMRVYKWQDATGQWHYGEKPPDGLAHESMLVDRNLNVIAGVKPPPEVARPQGEGEANGNSLLPELGNPYSPEKVKQLFEDARNVQNVLDERAKVQDELLNRY